MPKILIVDDDPASVELLQNFLERKWPQTLMASSGREALEAVRREQPDVVLLDLYLPDGNGLQFMRQMKETSPKTAIVIVTGDAKDDYITEALRNGASDYIVKPVDLEYLEKVLTWGFKGLWQVDAQD